VMAQPGNENRMHSGYPHAQFDATRFCSRGLREYIVGECNLVAITIVFGFNDLTVYTLKVLQFLAQ
jgi:hypothetical protein